MRDMMTYNTELNYLERLLWDSFEQFWIQEWGGGDGRERGVQLVLRSINPRPLFFLADTQLFCLCGSILAHKCIILEIKTLKLRYNKHEDSTEIPKQKKFMS